MNNKAQMSIEPMPFLLGLVGGIAAWIMASRMDAAFLMKAVTAILTAGTCYFIAWFGANK